MKLRLLSAIAATTAAVTLVPGAAHADRQSHADATGDVVKLSIADAQPVPQNKAADLTRIAATHSGRRLELTAQVRELAADGYAVVWDVKTPALRWRVYFDKGTAPAELVLEVAGAGESPCNLSGKASDRTDRVRVTVPRACLGNPRWIRFGALVQQGVDGGTAVDDGRRTGSFPDEGSYLGPRVRHS